jgi:hypothetical protein
MGIVSLVRCIVCSAVRGCCAGGNISYSGGQPFLKEYVTRSLPRLDKPRRRSSPFPRLSAIPRCPILVSCVLMTCHVSMTSFGLIRALAFAGTRPLERYAF